ncbi:MAG TPA: hypothetical protein VER17_13545 [Tepidisphaeraceae bacterium]|nr:hypothetical protein [Tepidisphaeraceae bacterium]
MNAQEQIYQLLGRRPFQPFRVVLTSGEQLDVVRVAQAAISPRLFGFVTTDDRVRRIALDQLDRVEPLDASRAAS